MTASIKWTKTAIRELLLTNDRAVTRGVLAIYDRQTASEQCAEQTKISNGVGFNSADAHILSSFAKQVLGGRSLTFRQIAFARKRIVKYSRQLADIANSKVS